MKPRPEPELPPPDERLRAALRHAPDAMLQPPPALNARVLGDARRALAPPPWRQRWSAWLMRPATAGTMASLLLVGFIGLMWRDGAPPDSRGRAAPVSPVAPDAPVSSVPPADAAARAEKIERSGAAEMLSKLRTPPGAARPAAPAAEALPGAPADPRAEARRSAETAAPPAPAAVAPAPTAAAPAQDRTAAEAQRPSVSAETRPAPAREAGAREQLALQRPQPQSPTADDPLAAPLAAMRAAAIDEPTLAWWTELRAATAGRWRRAADDAAPDAATAAPATTGSVRFETSAVIWQAAPAAPRWRAELDATQLRGLRERQPR